MGVKPIQSFVHIIPSYLCQQNHDCVHTLIVNRKVFDLAVQPTRSALIQVAVHCPFKPPLPRHRASSYSLPLSLLPSLTLAACSDCLAPQYSVTEDMNGKVADVVLVHLLHFQALETTVSFWVIHMRRSNDNREWRQHRQQLQRRNSLLRNLRASMISRCWANMISEPKGNLVFTT